MSVPPGLTHVLVTRFNLPSAGLEGSLRAAEGWLVERVALFEEYCLPSVEAQTVHDFKWIIYFDPQSPSWLKEWAAAQRQDRAFTAVYRATVSRSEMLTDIHAVSGSLGDDLLTTNVDNDDALATDFVARLQATPLPARRAAIYIRNGVIKRGDDLYLQADPHNAFCSVRESADTPIMCWCDWHNRLNKSMQAVVLSGPPGWLQVIHGRNVSNRVRGRRVSPTAYRDLFPHVLGKMPEPTHRELMQDALLDRPVRVVRETARAAIKQAALATMGRNGPDHVRRKIQALGSLIARAR